MQLADFALERFFARWEFAVQHVMCASDVESCGLTELLSSADEECAVLWGALRLGYTEPRGHPLLRAEIARQYDSLSPDHILVCAGAEEALFCVINVLLARGDHAVVTWPGYQSLYEVARATGATTVVHELRPQDGWSPRLDALIEAVSPRTKLIIVNVPHNPTGAHPTASEWREFTDSCARRGIRVLADEVYRDLVLGDADRLPACADCFDAGISVGVMSKAYGLAGLRIGWIATRDTALLERCSAFKDYTSICSAAPSEILALIALRARERLLARSRSITSANLALLELFFDEHPADFEWVRPRAGCVAFPRLTTRTPAASFTRELVEREGVLLLPGDVFGYPNHLRIGFGRADFPQALGKVASFIASAR